jgi:hypothetical protein
VITAEGPAGLVPRLAREDPYVEVLRLCARMTLTPAQAHRLRDVAGAVTAWEVLLQRAAFHGVLPLVAHHLDVPGTPVPRPVLDRVRAERRRITRRNVALTAELVALLDDLRARGIRAIPYKGPVLAASLYGDLGLRDFGDLDLLVRRRDVAATKSVLLRRGYRAQYDWPAAQEASFIETRYEHPFEHPDTALVVEVQWAVVPRYFALSFDYDAFWARTERLAIGGRPVSSLSPEDLLLVLTAHGGKHLWRRLGWVCDVAELLRGRPALDWSAVRTEADRLGGGRLLRLGLRLAREVLEAPLPDDVAAAIGADPSVARLAAEVQEAWWGRPETWPGVWETTRFHLRTREDWGSRLRYGVGLIATASPGDWGALALPRGLFPLYYPLRAVRLAVKYGGMVGRRLVAGRGPA